MTAIHGELPIKDGRIETPDGHSFAVRNVDWPRDKQRAANIAANTQTAQGTFSDELTDYLLAIQTGSPAAFEAIDLVSLFPPTMDDVDEDAGPAAPPKTPQTKRGDLWTLGTHRLLCGDSSDEADVKRLMNGDRAKLLATDPPYGVDYSKTKDGIPRSGFKTHTEDWGDIANDDLRDRALQEFLEGVFRAAVAHAIEPAAAWYLWHAHLTQGFFAAANVVLHRQIIWKKPGFVLTRSGMYHWSHEPCFFGWIKGNQPPWYGEKNQRSIWEIGRDAVDAVHPTQKPVELFAIPMRNHTRPSEICYEPFAGSGTQIIAAEQLGRRCFAMELEPRYCDVICARFAKLTGVAPTRDKGPPFRVPASD